MCTIYVRVASLRAAQNALAGRSLLTLGLNKIPYASFYCFRLF